MAKNFIFHSLVIIFSLVIASVYYLQKTKTRGTVIHSRHYNDAEIFRDSKGEIYIKTQTKEDAFYAMGYAQAQERLFQMNLNRKIPQGKMSELFGESQIETDKLLRTMGLARAAKKMEQTMTEHEKIFVSAYSNGVNDYVNSLSILPLEFQILGLDFEPWTPYDTFCFIKLLNLMLSNDWSQELIRADLEQHYGKENSDKIMTNFSKYLIDHVTIMNDEELKQMDLYEKFDYEKILEQEKKLYAQKAPQSISNEKLEKIIKLQIPNYLNDLFLSVGGSNAWVISGKHTTTGKPMLANDPHLEVRIPSVWNLIQISYLDEKKNTRQIFSGGSMPGGAGFFNGRSNYFAFGLTTLYADYVDLYYETIENENYKYEEKWYKLDTVTEKIFVKGQKTPIEYQVQSTQKGPLFFPEKFPKMGLQKVVSWSWPGQTDRDTTYLGLINIYEAQSSKEIEESLNQIQGPNQAIVWGTVDNDIGFFGVGRQPKKRVVGNRGHIQDGTIWQHTWEGYISQEETPRLVNPKKGYIVVANNKFASDNIKNQLTFNMVTTSRASRIAEIIEQKIQKNEKISLEDMQKMQFDFKDVWAEQQVPLFLEIYGKFEKQFFQKFTNPNNFSYKNLKNAIKVLQNWDYVMDKDQNGSTVFFLWNYFYQTSFLHETHPEQEKRFKIIFFPGTYFDHFAISELNRYLQSEKQLDSKWCQNDYFSKNMKSQQCVNNVIYALIQTCNYLEQNIGTNPNSWKYGKIHHHQHDHLPFSKVPLLNGLYSRSYPSSGSARTVHPSAPKYADNNNSFNGRVSGNIKLIHDLSSQNNDLWIIDSGNSENIFSNHYDDMLKIYQKGQYLSIKRDQKQINNLNERLLLTNQKN